MLSSRLVPLFETPLYISDAGFKGIRPRLLRFIRALRRRDPQGETRSNHRGWHSTGNVFRETDPVVRELERGLRRHVHSYLALLSGDRARDRLEFGLDGWVNVNGRGASNQKHVHPNAWLSGAYYLKVPHPLRSGHFVVWDPRGPRTVMHGSFEGFTFPWNSDSFTIDIATGRTVIFPAWLEHEVTCLEENTERISIAFNVRRPV
jgi:uncharacterized protein (TIGR02466 family)